MGGQSGRFAERIVAGQREHAAVASDPGEVGMPEGVAAAIDARTFPVPKAQHAIILGLRKQIRKLAAIEHRCRQVFVDPGYEQDVMLAQQFAFAFERRVVAAQGRAAIAADQRGGVEPRGGDRRDADRSAI